MYTARLALCAVPVLIALVLVPAVGGQEKKLKELTWSHAFDLACRKFGEKDIDKNTRRWGVEAFRDNNTGPGIGLYISEVGEIAIAPNFAGINPPIEKSKGPAWLTGLDLPTRKAGQPKFDKMTKVHSMEVFRDPNVDNYLFITEQGFIAACNGKLFPGASNKTPKWVHSVDLQVRKGGVKEFTKDTQKYGIEVYSDGNTGNLIYITEHGHVAIIPETKEIPADKGKSPDWLHGLDLSCRKSDEKSFTKDTRKFGIEVYHDVTTGNLIFISETGSIGVTPAPKDVKAPTPKAAEPVWTHGLNVKCRKNGEEKFSPTTKGWGAEVFTDPNVQVTIYVNEDGKIAVMSAK
jgi:hypothetical protein